MSIMQTAKDLENLCTPCLNCPCSFWNYLLGLQFEEELEDLERLKKQLINHRNGVERKVIVAEGWMLRRTDPVATWLNEVASIETDVDGVLKEGRRLLDGSSCLRFFWPCSWWTSQKYMKKLNKKIERVKELKSTGNFSVVAESRDQPTVQPFSGRPTIGLELKFEEAIKKLQNDAIGILGVYGMGGVGKTTLLIQIHDKYAKSISSSNEINQVSVVGAQTGTSCRDEVNQISLVGAQTSTSPFVIWVKISNEDDPARVQNEIGEKLKLRWEENSDFQSRAVHLREVLKRMKFLLLLDDIRKKLDIWAIGVPRPAGNTSKIVFTTQLETVCVSMEADDKIRVECLDKEKALKLFKQRVGQEALTSHWSIPKLAEHVAARCFGIPLVLNLVAETMATKKTPQEWNDAITKLRRSVADFTKMGYEYFPLSKFSYDDLPNAAIKSCFLFCALYPRNKSIYIEDLIQKWIGKGYIASFADWEEAINTGYHIIGILRETCLLEFFDGYVKMHDVIRELALWIYREDGKNKNKVLINTGSEVCEAPEAGKWNAAAAVSLTDTEITQLSEIPECPNLSTLLLFDNSHITDICDEFFVKMSALQFLDLSRTGTTKLPASVDKLESLEYLDLSGTGIKELNCEIKGLTTLKYFFLEHNDKVPQIPAGVMKTLTNLKMLKVSDNYFGDGDDERRAGIDELACLKELKALEIQISNFEVLRHFFCKQQLVRCTRALFIKLDPGHPKIINLTLSSRERAALPTTSQATDEVVVPCSDDIDKEIRLFRSLETLHLQHLQNFIVSWNIMERHGPYFKNLRCVYLVNCVSVVNVTWLLLAPNLRQLEIDSCPNLVQVLCTQSPSNEIVPADVADCENAFQDLQELILKNLPGLKFIYGHALAFPSLKQIKVVCCPNLMNLPLRQNSTGKYKLQSIQGSEEWWNNLKWDETLKHVFTPYFSIVGCM